MVTFPADHVENPSESMLPDRLFEKKKRKKSTVIWNLLWRVSTVVHLHFYLHLKQTTLMLNSFYVDVEVRLDLIVKCDTGI